MILYIYVVFTLFWTHTIGMDIYTHLLKLPSVSTRFLLELVCAFFFQIAPTEQGRATAKTCNQLVFVVFETVASKGIPQGKETCQSSVLLPTSQCAPWTKKNINHEYRFCFENAFAMRWRLGTTAEFMLLSCSY